MFQGKAQVTFTNPIEIMKINTLADLKIQDWHMLYLLDLQKVNLQQLLLTTVSTTRCTLYDQIGFIFICKGSVVIIILKYPEHHLS